MQTRIHTMLIRSSLLVIAMTSCAGPIGNVDQQGYVKTELSLSHEQVLSLRISNDTAMWLVCENLIDVDSDGMLNSERIVIPSGSYVGKTSGPSVPTVVVPPRSKTMKHVELAKNYTGLIASQILPQQPIKMSASLFESERDAKRFAWKRQAALSLRQAGRKSAPPAYQFSVQVIQQQ